MVEATNAVSDSEISQASAGRKMINANDFDNAASRSLRAGIAQGLYSQGPGGVWLTYSPGAQNYAPHDGELEARRFAMKHGLDVVFVPYGNGIIESLPD